MPEKHVATSRETRDLALAVVQVLQMWSTERYGVFLRQANPGPLTEEWFRWFAAEWNVARTIKDGKQALVREYLDQDFRNEVFVASEARIIDAAAEHIQKQGWSSQRRKDGQGSLPISLVSKIGFFFCPTKFVPLDRYALQGLNSLCREGGARRLDGRAYSAYLEAFNEHYARMEPLLAAALKESWAITLANKLGCPINALSTIAMRRKLFDDYLMRSGNYLR